MLNVAICCKKAEGGYLGPIYQCAIAVKGEDLKVGELRLCHCEGGGKQKVLEADETLNLASGKLLVVSRRN